MLDFGQKPVRVGFDDVGPAGNTIDEIARISDES